jgi:hypothetical protein
MNTHAHFLKCFIEDDLFFSLIIIQIKGCKSKQLEAKKSHWTHLRWTWNGNGFELLALIVATLTLGSRPRQGVVSGRVKKEAQESHHILPGV